MSNEIIGENELHFGGKIAIELGDVCYSDFGQKIKNLPAEVRGLAESELATRFEPTQMDYRLRRRIHDLMIEVNRGSRNAITDADIYAGVCRADYFADLHSRKSVFALAWITTPINTDEEIIAEGFHYAMLRVRRDLLTMPINERTAPTFMKALEFFANRHLGPMTQKMEMKSMNMNVTKTLGPVEEIDAETLLQKYAQAKAKLVNKPKEVNESEAEIIE